MGVAGSGINSITLDNGILSGTTSSVGCSYIGCLTAESGISEGKSSIASSTRDAGYECIDHEAIRFPGREDVE